MRTDPSSFIAHSKFLNRFSISSMLNVGIRPVGGHGKVVYYLSFFHYYITALYTIR